MDGWMDGGGGAVAGREVAILQFVSWWVIQKKLFYDRHCVRQKATQTRFIMWKYYNLGILQFSELNECHCGCAFFSSSTFWKSINAVAKGDLTRKHENPNKNSFIPSTMNTPDELLTCKKKSHQNCRELPTGCKGLMLQFHIDTVWKKPDLLLIAWQMSFIAVSAKPERIPKWEQCIISMYFFQYERY